MFLGSLSFRGRAGSGQFQHVELWRLAGIGQVGEVKVAAGVEEVGEDGDPIAHDAQFAGAWAAVGLLRRDALAHDHSSERRFTRWRQADKRSWRVSLAEPLMDAVIATGFSLHQPCQQSGKPLLSPIVPACPEPLLTSHRQSWLS